MPPGSSTFHSSPVSVRFWHAERRRRGTTLEAIRDMASPRAAQSGRRRRSLWTWNLGRIAGIPIRMHLTLLILLAWIAGSHVLQGATFGTTVLGLSLVVAIFAIIVVHELAHALLARRFGIGTRDIMLLPIGGIASLE